MNNTNIEFNNAKVAEQDVDLVATIGIDENGNEITQSFSHINNVLVSGTVGSGKSGFIKSVILSLIEKYDKDRISFIIYDSKYYDYKEFENSGYLFIPIIHDEEKVSAAINWLLAEADERIRNGVQEKHIFFILDDYEEVSRNPNVVYGLKNLLKTGYKTGIHTFIVTATPSFNVVRGDIKALINCQVAFATANATYSRMIIDDAGAEKLEYPGGMIFKTHFNTIRCKSIEYENYADLVKAAEKKHLLNVNSISRKAAEIFSENVKTADRGDELINSEAEKDISMGDELLNDAIELVVDSEKASVSMLQRRFRIGYNRAARIIDIMEDMGVVGPQDESTTRSVLWTKIDIEKNINNSHNSLFAFENDSISKPENAHHKYEVTMIMELDGDNRVEYKYNYSDVQRIVWHKKRLFKNAFLEVALKKEPYVYKSVDVDLGTGNYAILMTDSKEKEKQAKDFAYQLSAQTGITVETV